MWIASINGFYSIVAKPGQGNKIEYHVRARDVLDLYRLLESVGRKRLIPMIQQSEEADYPFRIVVNKTMLRLLITGLALSIDYPNFKEAVSHSNQRSKAPFYAKIWDLMLQWQESRGIKSKYTMTSVTQKALLNKGAKIKS